jgi:hypothetical protein
MTNRKIVTLGVYTTSLGILMAIFLTASKSAANAQCPGDLLPTCGVHDYCSPIIVDVGGHGFKLTSATDGVKFDITGTNKPIQIAWTATGSQNAFLAIDWNHNGKIDSGKELFGNFSPQVPSAEPNGFVALADLDKPEFGGNSDGIIDARDRMFSSLLLWIDSNHDGISQSEELFTLPQMGVSSISLAYRESRRIDEFGNQFRFKSTVNSGGSGSQSDQVGHIVYDVLLTGVTGSVVR